MNAAALLNNESNAAISSENYLMEFGELLDPKVPETHTNAMRHVPNHNYEPIPLNVIAVEGLTYSLRFQGL